MVCPQHAATPLADRPRQGEVQTILLTAAATMPSSHGERRRASRAMAAAAGRSSDDNESQRLHVTSRGRTEIDWRRSRLPQKAADLVRRQAQLFRRGQQMLGGSACRPEDRRPPPSSSCSICNTRFPRPKMAAARQSPKGVDLADHVTKRANSSRNQGRLVVDPLLRAIVSNVLLDDIYAHPHSRGRQPKAGVRIHPHCGPGSPSEARTIPATSSYIASGWRRSAWEIAGNHTSARPRRRRRRGSISGRFGFPRSSKLRRSGQYAAR